VMQALPQARLRLQNRSLNDAPAREALLARLARHGLDTSRVSLHGGMDRQTYLAAHADVDILLDTTPYPGGTTTCEALWMGVPTLSLRGHNLLSRQGSSLLATAGLPDWVAEDAQAMVALACHHAARIDELNQLRQTLRARVATSPLMDGARFAQDWAQALWSCATDSPTRANITHKAMLDST
jgi:protein O-GlcNAc transferase